jgi:N-methylhydantoinase A/oxoprolinase/acetone carboxylase beta subunit
MALIDTLGIETINKIADDLGQEAKQDLLSQGIAEKDITVEYYYYGMYTGQSEPNRLGLRAPLDEASYEQLQKDFHSFYDRRFGYQAPEIPIKVTAISAVATGPNPELDLTLGEIAAGASSNGHGAGDKVTLRATIHLDGKQHDNAPFYDRSKLELGDEVDGPCVIDDQLGTIVVNEGATVHVEDHGTLRIKV